ncbi:uncharacterized protein LOC129280711 [Lytechinus pictus]|uniref:uncharacterized protein LOC129280711 n=1 Tax=Lytechinus pictus TaxID=7653 RepID=UPI0030BA039B
MPIADMKQAHNGKSTPLGILNKGPEFFRQQALWNQRHHGKSAAEQLAESRSQFLKWDPDAPRKQLNDNSNNHSTDRRLDSNRTNSKQSRGRTVSPVAHNEQIIKQERIDEIEKRESRRGRDKNRENRRSRKRMKDHANDVNGNNNKTVAFEKASLDSPERDENLKETEAHKVSESGGETGGTTDGAEFHAQHRKLMEGRSKVSPRPSVKEMVSKIGGETSSERTADETPTRLLDHRGRDRPKRNLTFMSSESSETSPVLPRKGDYFSRNTRPPAVRGRERVRPPNVSKQRNNIADPKSPTGSHIQNVLNVLHQQASTSSSSHDETPRRSIRKSGAKVRGKSCPPTSRSKPSLADLLAKDANAGRPRSKDLNDLENLTSTESDDSHVVKSRIRSFQSPATQEKQTVAKTLSKKPSNTLCDHTSNHTSSKEKYSAECQISPTTRSKQFSDKNSVNSASPRGNERKAAPKGKSAILPNPSDIYSLPHKPKKNHKRQPSTSDASHCSSSSDRGGEKPVLHPKLVSNHNTIALSKKPLVKSKSADVGLMKGKGNSSQSLAKTSTCKPALPKKPDVSIINKYTRMSYHFYEEVTDPNGDLTQGAAVDQKENIFENPAHFSDPEESFEIVSDVTNPDNTAPPNIPDNVAVVVEDKEEGDDDPKQGSMFSSLSTHMKRLKGMLLREKDPQATRRGHDNVNEEQATEENRTKMSNDQSGLFAKRSRRMNYQSPTQRKLAAQLGLECKEKAVEFGYHNVKEKNDDVPLNHEGQTHKISSGETGQCKDMNDDDSKNIRLMLPVHSKSCSWDDFNSKQRLKTSLSDNTSLATSLSCNKAAIRKSEEKIASCESEKEKTSSHAPFQMPHEKQKQDLSKKLELFLKKSKAYDSPGSSPTKGSCESGKLKKKVSFDDSGIPESVERTSEKQTLIRKVSITPLNQNYDEVEYDMDSKKDLVEETIIIDSSNSIRLATPRTTHASSATSDTRNALKISEEHAVCADSQEISGAEEVEMLVELYDDPGQTAPSKKSLEREPSSDDNQVSATGKCQKTSKLVELRKASVSTDLDTSPTHDYRGTPHEADVEKKHKSGTCTSSSGYARAKGEYDTSSRSDDCGLGATRGKVKHLKPYNARPFRNKNFSSDEDVIPEEHTRKSFWQTKAQLDIQVQNTKQKTGQARLESFESSGDGDVSIESSSIRRSKSEPSNATSADGLDQFFERMGLDESLLKVVGEPHVYDEEEVFHEMHVWRPRAHRGSESDDSNTSYAMSETSNVSEEGVMNLRKFTKQLPDQSMSIVTKNARVIKWMCQCKKARNQSIS